MPTDTQALDAVIAALENATVPDRLLDGKIACAVFETIGTDDDLIYRSPIRSYDDCAPGTYWHVQRSGRSLQTAPKYTESLDAAVSLVPPHHLWQLKAGFQAQAIVWMIEVDYDDGHEPPTGYALPETPAIALCIAALRSRRALAQQERA
ncbi:MAG TPA: hypothetical protein VFX37_09855 [Pseudolabrys sp.]|nr:hypothetical protein [Pseudolabrys sp.]